MDKKIKNQKEIIEIIQKLKKQNRKIVALSGSFDILHSGHIKSLKEAKAQGDILIVLLNSDKSVKNYKGSGRPINYQKDRIEVLSALESVDYITIFNEITPKKILEKIKPDIFCQGRDWGKNCIEREVVEKYGGKIYVLKWQKSLSTTGLIKKILDVYSKPSIKAVFLDRDGTININKPEYLHKAKDFKFIPKVIPALRKLSKTDYKIIILTNQSGIGRGYFKEKDLKKLHQWLLRKLKKKGIIIDKIYHCPHLSKDNCSCRKPKIGMLQRAIKDFNLSLAKSWVIGDDERDIIMAREANVRSIKIGKRIPKKLKLEPNFYAKNLLEAVGIIKNYGN